jgi:hypothetical protein
VEAYRIRGGGVKLVDVIPEADMLIALEPDELGLRMPPVLAQWNSRSNQLTLSGFLQVVHGNPPQVPNQYPVARRSEIEQAVREAWAWLEGSELLIPGQAYPEPTTVRAGREFAAWLGMTPRQNSSGGKERLGPTSKHDDKYIRSLLIAGAVAVLRHARNRPTRDGEWVRALLARKPTKVAAFALANKTARIVWAVMMRADGYRAKQVLGLPA